MIGKVSGLLSRLILWKHNTETNADLPSVMRCVHCVQQPANSQTQTQITCEFAFYRRDAGDEVRS